MSQTGTPFDFETHRSALTGHCYRMLGSAVDADDAVQETLVRAWKAQDRFEGRSSVRHWLYRIATRVCLDALQHRNRREQPVLDHPRGTIESELVARPRSHWLEPIPDARALPSDAAPEQRAILRESIRLAFVAALQHLPPRQRACLLLTQVLGFSAAEVAELLDTSVPAVNSALQRARSTMAERDTANASRSIDPELLARYVQAFEAYDMSALTELLREDAVMSMPPFTLWLQGPDAITQWMLGRGAACRGSQLVRTDANGAPAWGQYKPGPDGILVPWSLIVVESEGQNITEITHFLDTETWFPLFDLPNQLPAGAP